MIIIYYLLNYYYYIFGGVYIIYFLFRCADTDSVNSDSKVEVEQFNVTPSEGTSEMPSVSEDPKTVNRCSVETEPQTVSKRGAQETLVSLIPERREPRNLSEVCIYYLEYVQKF